MRAMSFPGLLLLAGALTAAHATNGGASELDGAGRRHEGPGSGPSPDSNMGFRVDLRLASTATEGSPFLLALPLNLGTGDIADAAAAQPCSETGALRSDGVIDALDLLCELWTSRQGGLWISRHVASPAGWQSRGIWRTPGGAIVTAGDWTAPILHGEAVVATVLAPAAGSVVNDAVIVGSHDPSQPCPVIDAPGAAPATGVLNVFYHSMFRSGNDLLCGLKGMAWEDLDLDGDPDTCTGGLFDPSSPGSASVADVRDSGVAVRSVVADPAAPHGLRFSGPDFALEPTRAAAVVLSPGQPAATWCQPHF
jgi:hypothetical protein